MVANNRFGTLALVCLAALFVVGAAGCSDDLYSQCSPDEELGCEEGASCVSRPNFQCSTRVCAKYENSEPFCSQRCSSDGDCPGGSCEAFPLGTSESYCVPSDEA